MIQIIPAILATSEAVYQEQFTKITRSPSLQEGWVHLDLMDNIFVQTQSVGVDIITKYQTSLKKELHLMVTEPSVWLQEFSVLNPSRVIAAVEVGVTEIERFFKKAEDFDLEVGLSINPNTPLESLEQYVPTIDCILIMSVVPGLQGQPFIEGTLDRVREIKKKGWDVKVGLDGGIKLENIKKAADAGVDTIIIGSGLLKGNIDENIEKFWEILQQ